MKNYLIDDEFLKNLALDPQKEVYVKLISLTNDEVPREEITGRTTGGSINVDGSSAVRRTCSLSMLALEADAAITDVYWCLNTKFTVEIGLSNNIDASYPSITWFKMGMYIITNFSSSKTASSISISISGKDKMCRLNGEVSGVIMYGTDFGNEDIVTKDTEGNYVYEKVPIPIKEIIYGAVKEYSQELDENIIINDLDDFGYELWEYRGEKPMYMFLKDNRVLNITFDENTQVQVTVNSPFIPISEIPQYYSFNTLDPEYNDNATLITAFGGCNVVKINSGETAGYHQTPLIYGGELILNAGETITALLDKIKAMLGDYEYFYDLYGHFIFQKQRAYIQNLFTPLSADGLNTTITVPQYSYQFKDDRLFTQISYSPNINNIKNDFAVWGNKKNASGSDLPIHLRYAVDKKPFRYTIIRPVDATVKYGDKRIYVTDSSYLEEGEEKYGNIRDWRELIYQMALDYLACNQNDSFLLDLASVNPQFPDGKTGYEQYYTDIEGFWRELYNPKIAPADQDYAELYGYDYYPQDAKYEYWNKAVHLDPSSLDFWFDFLDSEGELGNYSVKKYDKENAVYKSCIDTRSKSVNDSKVNTIYRPITPEVLFKLPSDIELDGTGFTIIQIQDSLRPLFNISAQSISAIEKINELVNQHLAITDSLNITAIPIYHLQPNERIYINNYGDYIIDKLTFSLMYNSTMSLTVKKLITQFN